jgi:SAM-dependent methyltransferase
MHIDPEGKEKQAIAELLGPSAGSALEIGCGDGRLTRELVDLSGSLAALDPEIPSILDAVKAVPEGVSFLAGSGEELPFADNCLDTVLFTLSLHHQDPVKALGEARRVLKEDGRILVLEPAEHSLMNMMFTLLHDETDRYEHAEMAVDSCGLEEVRSGSVRTRWEFDGFEEMAGYLFDYMELEADPEKEEEMARLLGERLDLKPLHIEDITRFWLLQEGPLES